MIHCAMKENSFESNSANLSLAALIMECNDKILKEKEALYNFKFSSDSGQVLTDKHLNEPLSKYKKEEIVIKKLQSEDDNSHINRVKQVPSVPNIFKERVKSFLKNKNLL